MCLDFHIYTDNTTKFSLKYIVRRIKKKWWEKFTKTNSCPKSIQSWIEAFEHDSKGKSIPSKFEDKQADFLTEKSKLIAMLAQHKDSEEFSHLAQRAASLTGTTLNPSKASSSPLSKLTTEDFAQNNEDDCCGIDDLVDDF
ncbi:hypothetical protein Adt_45332 [Abeliophyllum distichum]|uniref:Uncharacterized protein n=1 Tax=Abeliophyllum distichum TaxID=126358 RepID=A0ABD1PDD9_9LAMI